MSKNLYIGNLSYETTEETLRTLFAEYGEIESANLITDRYTGRSRGFAFIEFVTQEEADAAMTALNGRSVDGRELRVDKAKPRSDSNRGGGGGGGGRSRW